MTPRVLPAFPHLPGIHAFFTTRAGGTSQGHYASLNLGPFSGDEVATVKRNWGVLLESRSLSGREPVLPRLCHGAALVEAAQASAHEADAVFTRTPGTLIAVTMADCLAALVADPYTGCVAAVHAGWRGSRDNILGRTLARLFAAGHCHPETTHVVLGPCLSPAALEVGEEVATSLPRGHVLRLATGRGVRPHFDLRGCNRAQAENAGVHSGNVGDLGGCTRGNPDLFFSHRRDAGRTGRMAACILLE